jgi:RimJ/RimL family protein N-acetyltransferase
MIVRECRPQDVAVLEHHIGSPGLSRYHEARFERHRRGLGTFLVAWIDDVPVGSGEVLWRGCGADEVQQRFPGCPEISGLTVWPPERQSKGVGTALIRAAEALAVQRGHHRIGLGVDDQNERAAALYLRLGYRETGCLYLDRYHYVDDRSVRHEVADPCRFLVKAIGSGERGRTMR